MRPKSKHKILLCLIYSLYIQYNLKVTLCSISGLYHFDYDPSHEVSYEIFHLGHHAGSQSFVFWSISDFQIRVAQPTGEEQKRYGKISLPKSGTVRRKPAGLLSLRYGLCPPSSDRTIGGGAQRVGSTINILGAQSIPPPTN